MEFGLPSLRALAKRRWIIPMNYSWPGRNTTSKLGNNMELQVLIDLLCHARDQKSIGKGAEVEVETYSKTFDVLAVLSKPEVGKVKIYTRRHPK